MDQEWYCFSKAIAQIMTVFNYFSIRRTQDANLVFHQSSDAIIWYDKMLGNALDKAITCAGEVLF